MVKKVIINLDLSKASGPDCIPVVVLKNCELDLCYILTELFNKFLKESCFPDCREVSSVVLVFKNVGKVLQVKTTTLLVFFLWFVKSLKNFRLTADLLTFVSGRITRAFNRSAATRAVALDISKVFDRVWHASLLHKLKPYGISGQIFGLISSFLSNRQLQVILDGKSLQEYPDNARVPQGSTVGLTLFLLYINDLSAIAGFI